MQTKFIDFIDFPEDMRLLSFWIWLSFVHLANLIRGCFYAEIQ